MTPPRLLRLLLDPRQGAATAMVAVAVLGGALMAAVSLTALAQEAQPRAPGAAPGLEAPTRTLIISVQRLNRDSRAGRSISEQAEALRATLMAEIEDRQTELRAEEQALVELRDELPRAEFDSRVAAFKTELRAVRRAEQEAIDRLQAALQDATDRFRAARNEVLTELMVRYQGAVMLDEASVVLSSNSINVTDEAIAMLDANTPRIDVVLPDTAP